jgi:hypothetical protein
MQARVAVLPRWVSRSAHPDEFVQARCRITLERPLNFCRACPLLVARRTNPMSNRIKLSEPAQPLTRELLDYWIQHPEALGTLEAIVEWWLLEHRIQRAVTDVRSILTELVEKGFVVERRQSDGRNRYELNADKENEIENWLALPIHGQRDRDKKKRIRRKKGRRIESGKKR